MLINGNLLKKDVEDLSIRSLIEEGKIENINGDWVRITDYFSFPESTVLRIVNKYKEKFGSLAPTISLVFLIYGISLEKREKYMNSEKDWKYVKQVVGKFPFDEYYDYERRLYPVNLKTLKVMREEEKYRGLDVNSFVHLQTWVLAVYLARLEELKIQYSPYRESGLLVSLNIKGNRKDIETVEEIMRKDYGLIFDLNAGWFNYFHES